MTTDLTAPAAPPAAEGAVRDRLARLVGDVVPADGEAPAANVFAAGCASRVVLDHVTSKWGVLVIVALAETSLRWGELRRGIEGISEKMLAQTLRTLEADGLVHREAQPTIPPRVDYSLTDRGHELAAHLIPLVRWVGANAGDIVGGR
ncbi:helix-turn-helix domain-containing protein [Cryobacterium sp. SO2]|uniref:winged helix-turn-helix transcriptional regulator n=1 Tax=Cryobacterium sp. SO2 TaxID=1897060 RepID=UPI00223DE956|nr:helix-turn-helix domain-containing protein [Cryobacterium sp. SO2]WEO77669.1 helix-turn-helix domain-containing protein [Cryobacterium sp. SO2]